MPSRSIILLTLRFFSYRVLKLLFISWLSNGLIHEKLKKSRS